jgi:hypothetical protein
VPKRLVSSTKFQRDLTQHRLSTQADIKTDKHLRAVHDTHNPNPRRFSHPHQPGRLCQCLPQSGDLIAIPPPPQAEVATLADLSLGATLWMRDPRNTPVSVTALNEHTASFTVEVLDFEDTGAQWTFPVWQSHKFRCAPEAPSLPQSTQNALTAASHQLNQRLQVPIKACQSADTVAQLNKLTAQAQNWLAEAGHHPDAVRSAETSTAFTDPKVLSRWLTQHDTQHIETDVANQYVSNPHAGETIKAHRLALADLGLCAFEGNILRDPAELSGAKSMSHRKSHIRVPLAFLRAAFHSRGITHLPLYRVIYSDTPLTPPRPTGFVSATFSQSVALRFLKNGQSKRHAALYWQQVPITRVFMTHLETPQMRNLYNEREALLLSAPAAPLF